MATIREVADAAKVSIATASRALKTPNKVSRDKRERVLAAVEALRYTPNLLARNFRTARSHSILVVVSNFANPFFSNVIRGIEHVAAEHGYVVLLGETQDTTERARDFVALGAARLADGVILLSHLIDPAMFALHDTDPEDATPVVTACEFGASGWPKIGIDNAQAAETAVTHLLSLGHRRIGVILGPSDNPLTRERLLGYRRALAGAGIAFDPALLVGGDFSLASGHDAVPLLLQAPQPPTGIFCFNDEMAIGAMVALRRSRLRVPEDVSVVGFDDIAVAAYASPPLTTVAQPTQAIGRTAMNRLIDLIDGAERSEETVLLPTEFVIRESTGPAPRC
jgi:LacI family repressor for deo operon, udp, cdd, tsx, nupC, and nupG